MQNTASNSHNSWFTIVFLSSPYCFGYFLSFLSHASLFVFLPIDVKSALVFSLPTTKRDQSGDNPFPLCQTRRLTRTEQGERTKRLRGPPAESFHFYLDIFVAETRLNATRYYLFALEHLFGALNKFDLDLSLIHIWRCRRLLTCRSRWSPYH